MSGRLRPGLTRADAQAELTTIMSQQDRSYVQRKISAFNRRTSLVVFNGSEIENPALHDLALGLLILILGPLALILVLACSNVATLFLSRTLARRGEIAICLALGVSRSRLAVARQLQWRYQWIILNEFLPTLVGPTVAVQVLREGPRYFRPGELMQLSAVHLAGFNAGSFSLQRPRLQS